jgi:L-lactate dehydrogenase complex protein LldG
MRRDELPAIPTAVTNAQGDPKALAKLFGARLEQVQGSCEVVARAADVAAHVVRRIEAWRRSANGRPAEFDNVVSWNPDEIPVPGLEPQLREAGLSLVIPDDLHNSACRDRAVAADIGITGVDAAFASTGSVMLASGFGKSRAASLLPLHHLLVVPTSRLFATFESWLAHERQEGRLDDLLRHAGQVVFVTGPSKSADIELQLTLGVHGPGTVHAVLFDDAEM